MASTLNNDTNLSNIHELTHIVRKELIHLLESIPEPKELVIDSDLLKPLDRIAGFTFLKEHGVEKIFKLSDEAPPKTKNRKVYLLRPDVRKAKIIANHVNILCAGLTNQKPDDESYKIHIVFVPRKLRVCEIVLEREGVLGYVTLDEFRLDFVVLDRDLLSLELPDFFQSFFLNGNSTWLHTIAHSLWNIQCLYGTIPVIYGLGRASKMCYELMNTMFDSFGKSYASHSGIDCLFLFDRDVDYATPLLTHLTYEALLDEIFGIKSGYVEFGKEICGKDQAVKLLLTCDDKVFDEIRDKHFSQVFSCLSNKAKNLQSNFEKRQNMSVEEMKDFIQDKLKGLHQEQLSLACHIGACEMILNMKTNHIEAQMATERNLLENASNKDSIAYIEELIYRQLPMLQTLRLLCIMSYAQGGLPSKEYQRLRTLYLQSYGYNYLIHWYNLKKVGLLYERGDEAATVPNVSGMGAPGSIVSVISPSVSAKAGKVVAAVGTSLPKRSQFAIACSKLHLIPDSDDKYDLKNPTDLGYVFSGAFIPLIVGVVNNVLLAKKANAFTEISKSLPVPSFSRLAENSGTTGNRKGNKTVLIYVIGGITYGEMAAFRLLGKLRGFTFLFATTATTNGNKLLNELRSSC